MMPFSDPNFPRAAAIAAVLTLIGPAGARAETISAIGGDDGLDVFRAVTMAFAQDANGLRVYVPTGMGSSGVVSTIAMGREMFGRLSRPLEAGEVALGLNVQPIFSLPVAVITGLEAPMIQLMPSQIEAILAGRIQDWSELGGPKQRIRIVLREDLKIQLGEQVVSEVGAKVRREFSDADVAEIVRTTPGVIGFVPYRRPLLSSHRIIPVGGMMPDAPGYGIKIGIRLIYRSQSINASGRAFLRFLAGDAAQAIIQRFGAEPFRQ